MKIHSARRSRNSEFSLTLVICICILGSALMFLFGTPVFARQSSTPDAKGYIAATEYKGSQSGLAIEIDAFWSGIFATTGAPYGTPNFLIIDQMTQTGCGVFVPSQNGAYYCDNDRAILIFPQFLDDIERDKGAYAPILIITHEWGHHIQNILGINPTTRKAEEVQADCMSGAFLRFAEENDILMPGDVIVSMNTAGIAGDQDPYIHGTQEERIMNIMRGYYIGVESGCYLPVSDPIVPATSSFSLPGTPEPITAASFRASSPLTAVAVAQYLPPHLPLARADCFRAIEEGALEFKQLLTRFRGNPHAESRLRALNWQATAYRKFACDTPADGEAGKIEVWIHAFANASGAQEAVDFFAATRSEGSQLMSDAAPTIGDRAMALSGPAFPGQEYTLYASQGPLLVRVTGISPSGIPSSNVLTVAQAVLAAQQTESQPEPAPSPRETARPSTAYLPAVPGVSYGECFRVIALGIYAYQDIVSAFSSSRSLSEIDQLGWQDGAYVVFSCPSPPTGRASQLEVIIHRFGDARAAVQAMPVLDAYVPGDNEVQECDTTGSLVVCVTGRSLAGQPLSDVQLVQEQVLTSVG